MQIQKVTLENIKSYRHATIHLGLGTTAIRGHNGAGKSTVVEAIGYALFDFLPYSPAARFVREGEKTGKVVVSFISALDDRLYEVERRCATTGSGAWFVIDPELRGRVAEGKEDTSDFLRQHLGIQTTLPLSDLFDNAIAVQQGTFTADFLLTGQNRKKKFDALLQVEEYRAAADALRESTSYLKDELGKRDQLIAQLTAQTADLPARREERAALQTEMLLIGDTMAQTVEERTRVELRKAQAEAQLAEIALRARERDATGAAQQHAQLHWQNAQAIAERAEQAAAICARAAPDHQRYLAAKQAREAAEHDAQTVQKLELARARAEQALQAKATAITQTQERQAQAQAAAQERDRLIPLAQQQAALEAQQHAAQLAAQQAQAAQHDLARIDLETQAAQSEAQTTAAQLAQTEALEPLAALITERRAQLDHLKQEQAARGERAKRLRALTEQQQRQAKRSSEAEAAFQAVAAEVASTTDILPQVAALPRHERECGEIDSQIALIDADIKHAELSLHASEGGVCPFLKEPCQNMARRGIASLDDYFGTQIAKHWDAKHPLVTQREVKQAEIQRLRILKTQADRLPDLQQQATVRQGQVAEQQAEAQRIQQEIAALTAAQPDEAQHAAAIAAAEKLVSASAEADRTCARLPALRSILVRSQTQIAQLAEQRIAATTKLATAQTQAQQLPTIQADLQGLGDPRRQLTQAETQAQPLSTLTAELAQHHDQHATLTRQLTELQVQLVPFAGLAERIAALQTEMQQTAAAHEDFLRHETEAQRAPIARPEAEAARKVLDAAITAHAAAQAAYDASASHFDPTTLEAAHARLRELDTNLATLHERLSRSRTHNTHLETAITEAEARLVELTAVQAERTDIEATQSLLAYSRDTIKEAGPFVMRALLREISSAANRIFGEIMGDRSATLTWQDDYDIILRTNAYERHFAQLSGGEQMSAALAVRLALLRTLTRATIAFFDEPTQNMDDERRSNLATQIRRISGFDQLLVISHDDTFEEGLDAVIWVRKAEGESQVESDPQALLPAQLLAFSAALGA